MWEKPRGKEHKAKYHYSQRGSMEESGTEYSYSRAARTW